MEERRQSTKERRASARGGRRADDPPLRDPERCPKCLGLGYVIDSRPCYGFRLRKHECKPCKQRWYSYQSLIDPRQLRFKAAG